MFDLHVLFLHLLTDWCGFKLANRLIGGYFRRYRRGKMTLV